MTTDALPNIPVVNCRTHSQSYDRLTPPFVVVCTHNFNPTGAGQISLVVGYNKNLRGPVLILRGKYSVTSTEPTDRVKLSEPPVIQVAPPVAAPAASPVTPSTLAPSVSVTTAARPTSTPKSPTESTLPASSTTAPSSSSHSSHPSSNKSSRTHSSNDSKSSSHNSSRNTSSKSKDRQKDFSATKNVDSSPPGTSSVASLADPAPSATQSPPVVKAVNCIQTFSSDLMAKSTLTPEEFDKTAFNIVAKRFLESVSEVETIEGSSKQMKAFTQASKKLLNATIALLKAKNSGSKKYRQKFVKAVGKFTIKFDILVKHLEASAFPTSYFRPATCSHVIGHGISLSHSETPKNQQTKDLVQQRLSQTPSKPDIKHSSKSEQKQKSKVESEAKKKSREERKRKKSSKRSAKSNTEVDVTIPEALVSPRTEVNQAWEQAIEIDDDDDYEELDHLYLEKEIIYDPVIYSRAKTAIENGNIAALDQATDGMQVNMQSPEDQNNTLLHWAVGFNRIEVVRILLMKGARNLANDTGMTPLELARSAYSQGDSSFFDIRNLLASLFSS